MPSSPSSSPRELPSTLALDEVSARRLVLVQAIESADPEGKLLGLPERDALEQAALQASRDAPGQQAPDAARYLQERARRFLDIVAHRNPRLAALQEPAPWRRVLGWTLPILALLMGAALDRIEDPGRVDMLSPPLLAFLAWNLIVYVLLVVAPWLPRSWHAQGPLAELRRWLGMARPAERLRAGLHSASAAQFQLRWWQVAGSLEGWRIKQLMHSCAALWALGIALSIAVGGLVRQYQVGWESTWLDASQVHAALRLLFAPVTALFHLEPIGLGELERMHFRSGLRPGAADARRWVLLYLGLLALLVMLPRTLLALVAAWRKRRLRRAVRIDLRDPYFAEVLARVSPVRVAVALLAPDASGREVLLQVLRQASERPGRSPPLRGVPWTFLESPRGDELRLVEVAAGSGALQDVDLVLVAASTKNEVEAALAAVRGADRPAVLLLLRDEAVAQREGFEPPIRALSLDACCRCWPLESLLHEAMAAALPAHQKPGMERLLRAWRDAHQRRWRESMRLLAEPLLHAAHDTEEARTGPLSLRQLLSSAEREASQRAREEAMAVVLQRLKDVLSRSFDELQQLHGLRALDSDQLGEHADPFVIRQALHAGHTSVAGAAGGAAAMGLAVDMMAGGMTLGAGALIGALVGGTSALAAAAWKNRSAPNGAPIVQLGDDMLQTLTDLAILRYLAVIHDGRMLPGEIAALPSTWKSEVIAAVAADREAHAAIWAQARQSGDPGQHRDAMAQALQATTRRVLGRLYGVLPDTSA
ncbi:MAG: DUF3482 domain-containing protein [Pseudomonadota bacterium]